jgi:predicted methyltransferase
VRNSWIAPAAAVALLLSAGAAAAAAAPAYVTAAVADASRPATDTERDANRKPAEVLAFAGVKPGMVVGEIMPGRGYYTRLLAKVVGPTGKVYAMVPQPFAQMGEGLKGIPNVIVQTTPGVAPSAPEKFDLLWTSENYHDFHMSRPGQPPADVAPFNKAAFDSLKPGGIFIVEDHALAPGAGAAGIALHRIDPQQVKAEMAAAGFKLVGESSVLKNPDDAHTIEAHDPAIRGKTDKFLMKFQKPAR